MPKLIKRRQLAAKIETIEGTVETLAAADAKLLVYNPKATPDPQFFDRNPITESFSKMGKLIGSRPIGLSFSLEMRGSGTATTEPEWGKIMKACGFQINTFKSISIGAITSGPFQHSEIITGAASLATGRVLVNTVNGASAIYFVPISGTFQSGEVITGSTSGATATTSSTPSDTGKAIEPLSLYGTGGIPSLTMGNYEDGLRKLAKGCRGNLKLNLKAGEPGTFDLEFKGVEQSIADVALLSGVSFETTKPPVFLSAGLTLDSYAARVSELSIDLGNVLASRDDVNDAKGILSFLITDRNPTGSLKAEMVSAATYDFHAKLAENAEVPLDFTLGTVAGNKFRFYAPKLQFTKVDDEDATGRELASLSFCLNGVSGLKDSEFVILCL
jgi:hypothetical protein